MTFYLFCNIDPDHAKEFDTKEEAKLYIRRQGRVPNTRYNLNMFTLIEGSKINLIEEDSENTPFKDVHFHAPVWKASELKSIVKPKGIARDLHTKNYYLAEGGVWSNNPIVCDLESSIIGLYEEYFGIHNDTSSVITHRGGANVK